MEAEEHIVELIVTAVRTRLSQLSDGGFMSTADAYQVAKAVAEEELAIDGGEPAPARAVRPLLVAADPRCRRLVASQLVGMTFHDVVETVKSAVMRFCGTDLEIVPKPTLAFSGYCTPTDVWNLYANGLKAVRAADNLEFDGDPDAIRLRLSLSRAVQMLHFLSQREVLVGDIETRPYAGTLRDTRLIASEGRLPADR